MDNKNKLRLIRLINKLNKLRLRGLLQFLGKNLLLKIEIWKFPYSCILTNAQIFI